MATFVLKKGTLLKHGTSLSRIREILRTGLIPGAERNQDRSTIELPPEVSGVYVGELTAYFGAYATYSAEVAPCLDDPSVMQAAIFSVMSPTKIRDLALPPAPVTLPLVITVELQENCELLADEDYVLDGAYPANESIPKDVLVNEAENVWNRWRSGVITKAIPPNWFKAVEYPRLSNLDGATQLHRQTWSDCELFIASLLQSSNRRLPDELMAAYVKRYGAVSLSQRISPTAESIDRVLSYKAVADNSNRLFNHLRIFQLMDEMAKEYGIRMVRSMGDHLVLR